MSKPKYMKGDCIRSLDDLVLQENIFWNGRIWNRKWFMNLRNGGYMIDKEIVQALRCCKFGVPCEKCPVVGNKDCFEEVNTAAADLIERLTAENAALREKVPQWISVEDGPPEAWKNEEDNTLINYMIYSPYFGVDIGNYHKEAGTWLCMALPCTVTHWMPLPEAPEEGDKHE